VLAKHDSKVADDLFDALFGILVTQA